MLWFLFALDIPAFPRIKTMATTDYRTDKPRLTDADGYRIPRLTQVVGPNLSREDRAFNKAER